jgi:hypothetical protein
LEDLTHVRERRKRTYGKRASPKQRRAHRHASHWAFAELQEDVASTALLSGSLAVQVEADQTGQACARGGYTAEDTRPVRGLLFACQVCPLALRAARVGLSNVASRRLLAWQDWMRTGVLSERPEVSSDEAEAVQRRRAAEVRWSIDMSSRAFAGVSDMKHRGSARTRRSLC